MMNMDQEMIAAKMKNEAEAVTKLAGDQEEEPKLARLAEAAHSLAWGSHDDDTESAGQVVSFLLRCATTLAETGELPSAI